LSDAVSRCKLFPVPGNMLYRETHLRGQVLSSVAKALPAGWAASLAPSSAADGGSEALLVITSGSGRRAEFKLQTGSGAGRAGGPTRAGGSAPVLHAAPYLPPAARERLAAEEASYADATGWVRLVSDDPMIAITARGAPRAPKRDQRLVTTRLDGPATGRIMSALLEADAPLGVRELAQMAHVSAGTVSKLLPTLEAEDALERGPAGRVSAIDRRRVLRRWTADYGVLKSNGIPGYFVAPRGVDATLDQICRMPRNAVTGAVGGALWLPKGTAPVIPITQLVAYADDPGEAATALGLVPVDAPVANAILVPPQNPSILDSPPRVADTPVAPLPLVLADLLTLPGRYPQQAEALMDALAKTDPQWRPRS
jgi:hypothetical protein